MTDQNASPQRPTINSKLLVLDTPDLATMTAFYTALLGVEATRTDDDWVALADADGLRLAFQLAPDFTPPTWPRPQIPQQSHLDLYVDDLDAAEAFVLSIGGRPVQGPEQSDGFRVYLDPAGHPFCLCV